MGIQGDGRSAPAHDPVYQYRGIVEVRCTAASGWKALLEADERLLILVKGGAGRLSIDRDAYDLHPHGGLGPVRGRTAKLSPAGRGGLHCYCLIFAEIIPETAAHEPGMPKLQDRLGWYTDLHDRLRPVFEQLLACGQMAGAALKRGRLLYTLLAELEETVAAEGTAARFDPIRETLAYIQRNFQEDIPREKLAKMAGLSPWHYSVLFKQTTGLSPIAYLNDMRIRKARELLLRPHVHMRDVAQDTGFRDEFYFSRKFKQALGVSPTVYIRNAPERLANLCFPFDGSMMALQLTPRVSIVNAEATHRNEYFRRIPFPLAGQVLSEQDMDQLQRADPYLIICGEEQALNRERLGRIAPTLSISWTGMGWRDHLLQIGGAVGKEKEAEQWLSDYGVEVADARVRIRASIGHASCLAVALYEDKLIAYRSRNLGELLYRDLQIAEPFEAGCPTFIKRQVDLAQLHDWDADCILLHVQMAPQAANWVRRLERDERWQALRAVRERRVFRIDEAVWREYSAFSHQYMVKKLGDILERV